MKVLIHTMYYLPEFGSAPILMNELAEFLSGRGHNVEVLTTIPRPPHHKPYRGKLYVRENNNGFPVKRVLTNFTVHHIGRLVAWSIYTLASMINLFQVRRGDVLFLRLPPLQLGVTGALAARWKKAKILLNVQDIHPDLSIESGLLRSPRLIKWALAFEKWIYSHSRDILVISEGFKKNLVDKGVDPEKIKIIPNWVDTDFLKPLPKDNPLSRRLGIRDRFVVMYSGTISISSISTLENILESAARLRDDPDIRFVIVGEGFKKEQLVKKAKSLALGNVTFLPFQPYADLPALLASADVLLVPLDKEKSLLSVPSKLYNFMAAGRPIMGLAHQSSEVRSLIVETGCGLCVSPDDIAEMAESFRWLRDHQAERAQMGGNSRHFAEANYSKTVVLGHLEQIIKGLNSKGHPAGPAGVVRH
jgi:colanic acid biosynthesis glycosyl transferase WcaI